MRQVYFLITKENCSHCEQAKEYLKKKNSVIIEIPIEGMSKEAKRSFVQIRKSLGVESITFPILLDADVYSGFMSGKEKREHKSYILKQREEALKRDAIVEHRRESFSDRLKDEITFNSVEKQETIDVSVGLEEV